MERNGHERLFRRLTFVSTSAALALTVCLTAIVAWQVNSTLVARNKAALVDFTHQVAVRAQVAALSQSEVIASDEIAAALRFPSVTYVSIHAASGSTIAQSGQPPQWTPEGPLSAWPVEAPETSMEWNFTELIQSSSNGNDTTVGGIHIVAAKLPVVETIQLIVIPVMILSLGVAVAVTGFVYRVIRDVGQEITKNTSQLESSAQHARREKDEADSALVKNREFVRVLYARLEAERRHIAREIHDELGARLVIARHAAAQVVESLESNAPPAREDTAKRAQQTGELLDQLYKFSRDILNELRPDILDTMDLKAAIEDMLEKWGEINPACSYNFVMADVADIGEEARITVYRIVQEALTNITKYAEASHVEVRVLAEADGNLNVAIIDDGVGFDPERTAHGSGLRGIAERAISLGGHAIIKGTPGSGTTIHVTIPVISTNTK